ncbi:MAG: DUF2236 domain-containing protein [Saprospiraceae bacterium]|nr:DUF2236 domain-containing protein [Saprospiraceae bacterium]
MSTNTPPMWKGNNLNDFRKITDAPADEAIKALYQNVNFLQDRDELKEMAKNDTFVPANMPPAIRDFINHELSVTYSEVEKAAFIRAHEVWKENGVQFIFVLFFRGLPYTYMAEKPANVLRLTKLLEQHPTRRILETAQFVFDVMDNKWWEPESRGILTALKVRLMHSAMRFNLLNKPVGDDKWDIDKWGMPISQEDLIATNQVFSLEFFKGMEMLGESLTPGQQADWFLTWKTIGRIMGIQKELLCPNVEQAWVLQKAVYNHLFPDDNTAGVALAKALVETLSEFLLSTKMVLIMMRKMIMDEDHPDLFFRVLGPTYGSEYPSVFARTRSADDSSDLDKILSDEFHTELIGYKERVIDFRKDQKAKDPKTRGDGGEKKSDRFPVGCI